jgi:hypothetical protein
MTMKADDAPEKDDYVPSMADSLWTAGMLACLNMNGTWAVPVAACVFRKTGELELTLVDRCGVPPEKRTWQDKQIARIRKNLEAVGGSIKTAEGLE